MTEWQDIKGTWVLVPKRQVGMIHFLGGAFVATAPHLTYSRLLEQLSEQGYVVVATPFVSSLDHQLIAEEVLANFERTIERLDDRGLLRRRYLPVYGLGHSMGCKLHLLIGSLFEVERAGNVLISFNNYAAKDAIPFMDQLSESFSVDFTPTPQETRQIVASQYQIKRNLLVKFSNDTIDQSIPLYKILDDRFANMVTLCKLPGNHLTPLGQDLKWQTGTNFTPLDAIGQWLKQNLNPELQQLNQEIGRWLNPFHPGNP